MFSLPEVIIKLLFNKRVSTFACISILPLLFIGTDISVFPLTSHNMSTTQTVNNYEFTDSLKRVYLEICQFKIQSAKKKLNNQHSVNGFKILLEDYIDMIYLLNNGNQAEYKNLSKNESIRINMLEDFKENSPYYLFIKAEITLHWVALKFRFGDDIKATWSFIQASKYIEKNKKLYPDFIPQTKSLGLIHILLGSVPDKYSWITKIIGLKGSIKQGLSELNIASKDSAFGAEAKFYLLLIKGYLLPFDESNLIELKKYVLSHKEYLSVYFLCTAIYLRNNKNELARESIRQKPNSSEYINMPIFHFYIAEISLQRGNYIVAVDNFLNYVKTYKGLLFKKEATLKTFYSLWLNNDDKQAFQYLFKVNEVGNTITDADKFSQNVYSTYNIIHYLPNKFLTKARFSFDGGFYENAEKEINSIGISEIVDSKEQIEYLYRKAKIYSKLGKFDQAISLFNLVIIKSEKQEWGFGANSTLQLGYIYKERNDKILAIKYFQKALLFKKHESKNSVDSKAKAALNEMEYN